MSVTDWTKPAREMRDIALHAGVYLTMIACDAAVISGFIQGIKIVEMQINPGIMIWKAPLHDVVFYLEVAAFGAYLVMASIRFFRRAWKCTWEPV
jgi:hypothetical protein